MPALHMPAHGMDCPWVPLAQWAPWALKAGGWTGGRMGRAGGQVVGWAVGSGIVCIS